MLHNDESIQFKSGQDQIKFTTPTKWKEAKDKNDCFFCLTKVEGVSKIKKKKSTLSYC